MDLRDSFEQPKPALRMAGPQDAAEIVRLVNELAEHHQGREKVHMSAEQVTKQLESPKPPFECILAEFNGKAIGLALFFQNYSTWEGKPGMFLEDIYVDEVHRRTGVGRELMQKLADICKERDYGRLDWHALDWNSDAGTFFSSIGAKRLDDLHTYRLDGGALKKL
ncbi:MAG: GNAT family N-acetyltransferase [Candidatus Kaiserbacteria bacterium]|nr:MAG: GNAT family N-acetyltransferase [Candidatus Kaiserbacteria bacterium]